MHSLKSIFAFISFLVGTLLLVWAIVLTQVPWEPQSDRQAVAVLGTIFGVSLASLSLSWMLVRRARIDIVDDQPYRWRGTDVALCSEITVCGLFMLLTFMTLLK